MGPRDGGPTTLIDMDGPAALELHAAGSHEPTAACPGTGLGPLESTQRWTGQRGLRYPTTRATSPDCTEWGRRADPFWNRLKAVTNAGRAYVCRDQDVPLWDCAVTHRSFTPW
jgi:hypothetical protein